MSDSCLPLDIQREKALLNEMQSSITSTNVSIYHEFCFSLSMRIDTSFEVFRKFKK